MRSLHRNLISGLIILPLIFKLSIAQNNTGIYRTITPALSGGASSILDQIQMQKGVQAVNVPVPGAAGVGNTSQQLTDDFDGINFDDNVEYNDLYFIPPDAIAAAGPDHVVSVVNAMVEWHAKGVPPETFSPGNSTAAYLQYRNSLRAFFADLQPQTPTFDPKVIYDQYAGRFIVVTLERQASIEPGDLATIMIAVSATSDPNDGWYFQAIDALELIGGSNNYADYPGIAVDDKAIYITANMFSLSSSVFGGSRLWIIDKGLGAEGLYDGYSSESNRYDPSTLAQLPGQSATLQPAHVFGSPPGQLGTFLVSSGWGDQNGGDYLSIIRVDDPLGQIQFLNQFIFLGNITDFTLPDAPQPGNAATIETNDTRMLNAVWRDDNLWAVNTVVPVSGTDAGQATAHWYRIGTSNADALQLDDQGDIGGEDLGDGTFTFFPAVAVDQTGNMAVGFSASGPDVYPGAYFTTHLAGDPAGTVHASEVLRKGEDYYIRRFGGTRNRWGDYSGMAVDPSDESTFWVFNQYAGPRGSVLQQYPEEDGRWQTAYGSFRIENQPPVANDDFAEVDEDGVVQIDVLANDLDPNNDPLVLISVSTPVNGTAAININQTVQYTPDDDFNGEDAFNYVVSDGNGGLDTAQVTITVTPVNDRPVALDDQDETNEDTPVTIAVLANDSDPDEDALTVSSVTNGTNGGVVNNNNGTVTYSPAANYHGTDSFTYVAGDGKGGLDTAQVTITITPVNDRPLAVDDQAETSEDTPVQVNVVANDSDVDGDDLTVSSVTQGAKGQVTNTNNGTVTYTPQANTTGQDIFTYVISDGNGGLDTAQLTINVTAVNDRPLALDDQDETPEDTPVTIAVLANDSDPDEDALTVNSVTSGTNGGVVNNNNGTVTYSPAANYHGTDSFTYVAGDGKGGLDTAQVTITVTPVNDRPVAVDDQAQTNEDTPVQVNVVANDSDVDGDNLTVSAVTQGSQGQVTNNNNGTVTYTPQANTTGQDIFTYVISDGNGGLDTAQVTIFVGGVNDRPVALDDQDETPEDTPVTIAVLANDSDPDEDALTVSSVTNGTNGGVVNNNNGTVTYSPAANYHGTDSFTYVAGDGKGGLDTAQVTITITPVNDRPLAVDDQAETSEDTPVQVNVVANDSDVDGDDLTVSSVTQGAKGQVTNTNNGTVTYTPQANTTGQDIFTYVISDGNGGLDTAQLTINVTAVNDRPLALDDQDETPEDTPVTIAVLANDSDPDEDALTVNSVTSGTNGGVVNNNNGTVTYSPAANYHGTDSFTYVAGDGKGGLDTAQVTITVTPVNDRPVAVDDQAQTNEDTPVQVNVVANDSDVDGDNLTVSAVTQGSQGQVTNNNNGTVTYAPQANTTGQDIFTYVINDGNGGLDTAQVTVNVNPVNDPPVANEDAFEFNEDSTITVDILANDLDQDGDTLVTEIIVAPKHGAIKDVEQGNLSYTPVNNFFGADSFRYSVSDPQMAKDTAWVFLRINPVNDPPEIVSLPDSIEFIEVDSIAINIFDFVSDVETADSSLDYIFMQKPELLSYSFDSTTGRLVIKAENPIKENIMLSLKVSDPDGGTASDSVKIITDTGSVSALNDLISSGIPVKPELMQNYPNPFNPATVIRFGLVESGQVSIEIYNLIGEKVEVLTSKKYPAGYHTVEFNGSGYASGMYLYVLKTQKFVQVKKMILVK